MADEQGVTQEVSPTSDTAGYVTADRPVQNLAGEFNRKFGALSAKVDQLTNLMVAQAQANQPAAQPSGDLRSMSDDQLWDEAAKGDKNAFTLHQQRLAAKTYAQMRGVESEHQMIEGQIAAIGSKYPVLRDPNHPLTQHTNAAYQLYLKRGRPAGNATWLEAAKTAITDRPDLVSDLHSQTARASETSRRQGMVRQTGAAHRDQPVSESVNFRTSKEDLALANRMGVRDPDGAKRRFLERQRDGRSSFGLVAHQTDIGEL